VALASFVAGAAPAAVDGGLGRLEPMPGGGVGDLLHATALLFVAYTGYGRIATLGEEVRDPRRSIPRAVVAALAVTMAVYLAVVVGAVIALLSLLGSVTTTWSFSAFTVLVYYAITNLVALRVPPERRLYATWVSWLGLASCLGLAFSFEPTIWGAGLALVALGLLWHRLAVRLRPQDSASAP
jgi:hypothetical protein